MSESPVTVAIAGQGRSGYGIHAAALRRMPERFRIVAVMDADAQRAAESAEELGCRSAASFEELVADAEAEVVVVATPSMLHVEHAIAALEAGKHVVCEKPVGFSAADVDKINEVAQRKQRVFAPFQNLRFDKTFQKVLEIIGSGVLGRIVEAKLTSHSFKRRWDWQTLQEFGGGELNNTAPHLIDQALEVFGPGEFEVFCDLQRTLTSGDAEDHVKVVIKGADNPTIDIELSNCFAFQDGNDWRIAGTSGGLISEGDALRWKWVDWSTMPERPVSREPTRDRSYNKEQLEFQEERWEPDQDDAHSDTRRAFYDRLYAVLREGADLLVTPESVRRRMELIDRCHRQAPLPEQKVEVGKA